MRIVTGRRGRLALRLDAAERRVLTQLLNDLDGVLNSDPGTDASAEPSVRDRLFPAAYRDDAEAAAEFRSLTEATLRSERGQRLAACQAELAATDGDVDLSDPNVSRRWIQVLNDLRLTHGTRLGVSEDDQAADFDPGDPAHYPRLVYYWLSAVQDTIVTALLR